MARRATESRDDPRGPRRRKLTAAIPEELYRKLAAKCAERNEAPDRIVTEALQLWLASEADRAAEVPNDLVAFTRTDEEFESEWVASPRILPEDSWE